MQERPYVHRSFFQELKESPWLTTDEVEAWEPYGSEAMTLGSLQILGSPLATLEALVIRRLRNGISAKNAPAAFMPGNRAPQMERYKNTLPVFRTGGRRGCGL